MRWPWVRGGDVVAATTAALAAHDRLDAVLGENERLLSMLNNLFEKYHALKLQGATITEPRATVEAKEPDGVQYVINEKAGSNHALRLHLTRYAARERLNHTSDEQIIDRLSNWRNESDDE